jgi:hypothetical protein
MILEESQEDDEEQELMDRINSENIKVHKKASTRK